MDHNINSVLMNACLGYNSDDTQDESKDDTFIQDIIEDTPHNSPTSCLTTCTQLDKKNSTAIKIKPNLLYSSQQRQVCSPLMAPAFKPITPENLTNTFSFETGEHGIDAPLDFPLTPCMSFENGERLTETLGPPLNAPTPLSEITESSIEAPAFSPLTPNPLLIPNSNKKGLACFLPSLTTRVSSVETLGSPLMASTPTMAVGIIDYNIDPPALSSVPSKPSPALACKMPEPFPPSPIPQMSPKTKNLLNILEGFEDFSSDDSVRDPDYIIQDMDRTSCSETSDMSTSVITTQVLIHNNDTTNKPDQEITTQENHNFGDSGMHHEGANLGNVNREHEQQLVAGEILSSDVGNNENISISGNTSGRPRRGRKRNFGQMTRDERKQNKYKNLPYINYRKKLVEPKSFINFDCGCPKKCAEKISVEDREREFKKFYDLGTYLSQNMYIVAGVKEEPVKRPYISHNISKKKTYTRQFFLKGILVCKKMFVKTIQTTPKRIDTALKKMRTDSITDKRGMKGGHNKVSVDREDFLINLIEKLPKYVSHYCRQKAGDAKFLRADMTFSKIYQLYCEEATSAEIQPFSYAKAKKIFLTKFNLRTKSLNKDTCNKCDYYENKKNTTTNIEEKNKIIKDHEAHLKTAEDLQKSMKNDMILAKNKPHLETITFDMEKTLPLPRIPTNIVFYKRQIWLYNLGIHTGSNDQGHCNVWVEGDAGRGAQEVGSCLIKHLSERLKEGVTHLILWSDSCGGQNRNIKLTLMLKAFLEDHPTLQQISMKFLESGHSFLPNDTDFGKVENALKYQQRVYSPEDYINIMKACKKFKPLQVHRMESTDFLSSRALENNITNRKKTVSGEKVSWLKTKEILLKKEAMFSLFMRYSENDSFVEVDLQKRGRGNSTRLIAKNLMQELWPHGKKIPQAKLEDIKSLLHLIPTDAQPFYKALTGDSRIVDDIDGFSGEPDFELEMEEDGGPFT